MKLSNLWVQYPLSAAETEWSNWLLCTINTNIDGQVTSLELSELGVAPYNSVDSFPARLRVIDKTEPMQTLFYWLIINSEQNNQLYKIEYIHRIKTAEFARPYSPSSKNPWGTKEQRRAISTLANPTHFIEEAYKQLLSANEAVTELARKEAICPLTKIMLDLDTVRPADEAVVMRLTDDDVPVELKKQFDTQCIEAYQKKIELDLNVLLTQHHDNLSSHAITQALTHYLKQNWDLIKGTLTAYTALPHHPVTLLMVNIATNLAEKTNTDALQYLMPGITAEPLREGYPNLNKQPLLTILRTHILSECHHYLLPIQCLIDHEFNSQLINPYYDFTLPTPHTVTESEYLRLEYHSWLTQHLVDKQKEYASITHDQNSLLGQLHTLCHAMKKYDAHGGIGQQASAANGAYPAIMRFLDYYQNIEPCGIHLVNHMPPVITDLPTDRQIGYVVASEGHSQALYFINRYDDSITLLKKNTELLNYPVSLLTVNTLPSPTPTAHPTIIWVKKTKQYFTFEYLDSQLRAKPLDRYKLDRFNSIFPQKLGHSITLAISNVPVVFYELLEKQRSCETFEHILTTLTPIDHCTPEQKLIIYEHTRHQNIAATTKVPQRIHEEIMLLWQFMHDISQNINATEIMATCIGTRREQLEPLLKEHEIVLSEITLSNSAIQHQISSSKEALKKAEIDLMTAIKDPQYGGKDRLGITKNLLDQLNISFLLDSLSEVQILQAMRPDEINLLLDNPEVRRNLIAQWPRLEELLIFFIETPARTLSAILTPIKHDICKKFIRAPSDLTNILSCLPPEKSSIVFHELRHHFPVLIKIPKSFQFVFKSLSSEQRSVFFNEMKDAALPNMIRTVSDFAVILKYLSPEQCRLFCQSYSGAINTMHPFNSLLEDLSPEQCAAVCGGLKSQLTKIYLNDMHPIHSLLPSLSPEQTTAVCNELKDMFSQYISTPKIFYEALEPLEPAQRITVYELCKDKLPHLINHSSDFNRVLEYLSIEHRTVIYQTIKDRLPSLVNCRFAFDRVFEYLLPEQCFELAIALTARFPRLMDSNASNFYFSLELLSPEQCHAVCDAFKDRMLLVIHDGAQLADIIKRSPIEKSLAICEALKNQLPQLSQRSPRFNFIGEILDFIQPEDQKNAFCFSIRSYLIIMMKKAGGLNPFLQLHAAYQGSILLALKQQFIDELNTYIQNISHYQHTSSRPDFRHGFWAFKQSKALNREINYTLAIKLKSELSAAEADIQTIFERTEAFRQEIISSNHFDENPNFVDRGIKSTRLNRIINKI